MKLLRASKTKLDVGCFSPAFEKYAPWENSREQRQNGNVVSGLHFIYLAFLKHTFLFDAELEHSRSDLVFEKPRLRET